jgi:hypothetical protein
MIYIFLFLLTVVFDGENLLGGTKMLDLLGLGLLMGGIIHYFPIRRNTFYFTPIISIAPFLVFIAFFLLVVGSFWRTHNFLFSNINIIRNSLLTVLFPLLLYLVYMAKAPQRKELGHELVLALVHVLGIFCIVNFFYTLANPQFADINSALLKAVGIPSKKYIFPLYETVHPNTIGSLGGLLMVLAAGCIFHLQHKSFTIKKLFIAYVVVGFGVAVLGDSRGTLFGAIACVIILVTLVKIKSYPIIKYLVFLFPFTHVIFLTITSTIASTDAASNISRDGGNDMATGNSRKFIYETANRELKDFKPIHLVGYGEYGIYGAGLTMYYMEKFGELTRTEQVLISVAHNSALQAIFDIGYIGIFFYIMLMFIVLDKSQKLFRQGKRAFILITFFLFYHMVTGMSETYYGKYAKVSFFMLMYITFVAILTYNYERYKKKRESYVGLAAKKTPEEKLPLPVSK